MHDAAAVTSLFVATPDKDQVGVVVAEVAVDDARY